MPPRFPALHALLPALALLAGLAGCARPAGSSTATAPAAEAAPDPQAAQVTLASVIRLRPGAADGFVRTMQANARHSRGEPGALSFDVFRPEDGTPTLVLFERWRDQAALDAHMRQPTVQAVLDAIPQATSAAPEEYRLVEVPPYGAASRRAPADAAGSRNVVVFLRPKPGQDAAFVAALQAVMPHARAAPGNAAFELYRDAADPHAYVLLERWDSVQAHEAHLAQPYSARLDAVLPGTLAAPITDGQTRFVLHDIAG